MDKLCLLIFGISALLILHTYLFYPFIMIAFFSKNKKSSNSFKSEEELPAVAVLIAAFNEEKVIGEKIVSVFNSTYPQKKIKVYVGSDASADATDSIVDNLKTKYSNLELVRFEGRVGKINIINHLQSLGDEEILIMTDANVLFKPETIFELIKYFKNEEIGIVAANIIKVSEKNEGISYQEKMYLSLENKIKAAESNAFQLIMGSEGGCYAIRNNLFSKVPSKFNVDDFYITFQVLLKGKKVLFNPQAVCTEDVHGATDGEYRRKVRISSGNFQNLFFFKGVLLKFWSPMGFAFWSHKVLRWLTPFFMFFSFGTSAVLMYTRPIFIPLFILQTLGFLFPLINHVVKFNNPVLKFISHFYLMNFALLEGFIRFSRGINSSIWQPVKRNV